MKYHLGMTIKQIIIVTVLWVLGIFIAYKAIALPNPAWEAQRIQAERNGDMQRLRILNFIGKAGTLRYPADMRDATGNIASFAGTTYHQSCCGRADAYEADELEVDEAWNLWAILTCNDPDDCVPVEGKPERPPGTKVRVPPEKVLVNFDPVNDTEHGWVWIAPSMTDADGSAHVYCFSFGILN